MLTPKQFRDWQEFYRVEPWGFHVDDHRYAVIASSIYRAMGAKGISADDFRHKLDEEDEPTPQETVQRFRLMFGGRTATGG